MWRDSTGGVHTLAPDNPRDFLPSGLVDRIGSATSREILESTALLNRLHDDVFDGAAELADGADEAEYEMALPPSRSAEVSPVSESLPDDLAAFLASIGPRWRLDFLELLQDLLDDAAEGRETEAPRV